MSLFITVTVSSGFTTKVEGSYLKLLMIIVMPGFDVAGADAVAPQAARAIAVIGKSTPLVDGRPKLKLYFLGSFMSLLRNYLNDGMKS